MEFEDVSMAREFTVDSLGFLVGSVDSGNKSGAIRGPELESWAIFCHTG